MKHIKPMTKKGKMTQVIDGEITKTIRPFTLKDICDRSKHKSLPSKPIKLIKKYDEILFYEWLGKPYRSKWGRRHRVIVTKITFIKMYKEGINFKAKVNNNFIRTVNINRWEELDNLAIEDGFKSGKEMGEWFNERYLLESFDDNEIRTNAQKIFYIIDWS